MTVIFLRDVDIPGFSCKADDYFRLKVEDGSIYLVDRHGDIIRKPLCPEGQLADGIVANLVRVIYDDI